MPLVTGRDGTASQEVPIGKVVVSHDGEEQEAWVALDQETLVEFEC